MELPHLPALAALFCHEMSQRRRRLLLPVRGLAPGLPLLVLLLSFASSLPAQAPDASASAVRPEAVRGELEFLAGDALQGRGSGTHDELLAATYIASELRQFGIQPAGPQGDYIEKVGVRRRMAAGLPTLSFPVPQGTVRWTHGGDMLVLSTGGGHVSGPLQVRELSAIPGHAPVDSAGVRGAVVYISAPPATAASELFAAAAKLDGAGAAVVLLPDLSAFQRHWKVKGAHPPHLAARLPGVADRATGPFNMVVLRTAAAQAVQALPTGTSITLDVPEIASAETATWNAIGVLRGRDPQLAAQTILLTAHLDHLGSGTPVAGDNIYNGADDDATGCVAVLQLARALGAGPAPRRTVVFAFFGSEEVGGYGARYFLEHPPVPLARIVANLEFEMIGWADPAVAHDALWLTGWERSDLGPALAAHGAKLVADPHPGEDFFMRSDNIQLARRGVVAQTVSSFGLQPQYHQPSDDLAHIDFPHLVGAIQSMVAPVEWLVNSDFVPQWRLGGRP
ncbi:MAG: M28 family metallopeptidase [Terriglobales bacterium]